MQIFYAPYIHILIKAYKYVDSSTHMAHITNYSHKLWGAERMSNSLSQMSSFPGVTVGMI